MRGYSRDKPGAESRLLFQSTVPIGWAPAGSMAANGAVTLGTALDIIYGAATTLGIWLHFPAGAVFAGSAAGFYWTVMSSTTVGQVFNNIFSAAADAVPTIPASTTAVSAAGPGAFTGAITPLTAVQATLPGGLLSVNGAVRFEHAFVGGATATFTKGVGVRLNGVVAYSHYTTTTNAYSQGELGNCGSLTRQSGRTASAVPAYLSANTAQAQALSITLERTTNTEFTVLSRVRMTVFP